jgi:hypothetical protein
MLLLLLLFIHLVNGVVDVVAAAVVVYVRLHDTFLKA